MFGWFSQSKHSVPNKRMLSLLVMAIFVTAFAVVYAKDMHRRLFIDSQNLAATHQELLVQQGRLLLEQSTLGANSRVQRIASQDLHMVFPSSNQIVVVSY